MTNQGNFAAHRHDGNHVIKVLDAQHPAGARFVTAALAAGRTGMDAYLSTLRAAGVILPSDLTVVSVEPLAVRHRWVTGPVLLDYASVDPPRSGFLTTPPGDLDLGAFSIRVHTDDTAFRQIVTTITRSPGTNQIEPVPGLVMLESVQPTGERCYVITIDTVEHHSGAYAVAAQGRRIDLYTHSGTLRPHRYPIRLIREAMLRTYEDAGGVLFHAAGVDIGGTGVMICGPRGAGKTTITAALLRWTSAALLSNDRLIIHQGDHVVAVPLPVPTARGTIEAFPELKCSLRRVTAGVVELGRMPADFGSTVKYPFTARQFAQAFSAGLTSTSTLRLVVVPQFADTCQPARLRHLSETEARQVVAANCFTPRDEFWVRPWLIPRQKTDDLLRYQASTAIQHIMATVPCVEVNFGVRNPITDLECILRKLTGGIR